MIRFSAANLFTHLVDRNGTEQPFAVCNPEDHSKVQALSAGCKFYYNTKKFLLKKFQVDPKSFSGDDARCSVPEDKFEEFLEWFIDDSSKVEERQVVWNPAVELIKRLTEPYWMDYQNPPLLRQDLDEIHILQELKLVCQPQPDDESYRGGRGAKVRIFRQSRLKILDESVLNKLLLHPAFHILTEEELKSTNGGRKEGRTNSGLIMVNNLGVDGIVEAGLP